MYVGNSVENSYSSGILSYVIIYAIPFAFRQLIYYFHYYIGGDLHPAYAFFLPMVPLFRRVVSSFTAAQTVNCCILGNLYLRLPIPPPHNFKNVAYKYFPISQIHPFRGQLYTKLSTNELLHKWKFFGTTLIWYWRALLLVDIQEAVKNLQMPLVVFGYTFQLSVYGFVSISMGKDVLKVT